MYLIAKLLMIHNFLVTPLGISDDRNDNLEEMIDQFDGFDVKLKKKVMP